MKNKEIALCLLLVLLVLSSMVRAQDIKVQRIESDIVFDGRPDEMIWKDHAPFPFYMYSPIYDGDLSEETDVRLCYDDTFLYVGASLFYKDISQISTAGKKRDYDQATCDWFGIHLDSYHDKRNAMLFYTNPNGIRFDAAVKRDYQYMEQDGNMSWNAFWEVKTQQDDAGWYAEFRIPLSTLRFEEADEVRMGLTINRYIPKKNESQNWPHLSQEYTMPTWKPSLSGTIVFEDLKSRKPLYVSPYVIGGISREMNLNAAESGYIPSQTPKYDAGLDVKFGLTNNLTMDVTLNTDFAQVEADDQQINLTRHSLFFPEKRVFFQEKADVFDFPLGGPNNLFYSRRIGLSEDGPVRILGGLRMSGRANGWDIGILDMQTGISNELPSENFGVIRLKKTVFNSSSYIGGMITSRVGLDGRYNFAYGLDGTIRVVGDEYFNLRLAQTIDSNIQSDLLSKNPSRIHMSWERRRENGFVYDVTMSYSGDQFEPGMGFEWMENYAGLFVMGHYGWIAPKESFFQKQKVYVNEFHIHSLETNQMQSNTVESGWGFEAKNGLTGKIGYSLSADRLVDSLWFNDDTYILEGDYSYSAIKTEWMMPPTSPVQGMIMTETGQFYDGWKWSASLIPTWSISPSFDLSGTYRIDRVDIATRDLGFTNHIIGVKALLTFTTKLSLAGFVQYNTDIESVVSNVRFRYNPREGVDFYLVYNEGLNSHPYRYQPNLPLSDTRTLLAKFTYTWGR